MPTTPQITLTANLETIAGGGLQAGYIRVTLCGYGPITPAVPGAGLLADSGVPQFVGPQTAAGTPLQVQLYGNDVITPANTFYEIAVLDANKNVIQANNYQFSGSGSFDLSSLAPIVPPYGFPIGNLVYEPCTSNSAVQWVAPGPVMAVSYNGILLPEGLSFPINSYTLAADNVTINLNFATEPPGDRIDAFCVL
jgi:hypothetical protein